MRLMANVMHSIHNLAVAHCCRTWRFNSGNRSPIKIKLLEDRASALTEELHGHQKSLREEKQAHKSVVESHKACIDLNAILRPF